MYKLDKARLDDFLAALCQGRLVLALEERDDQYFLVQADGWQADHHTLGDYRPVEPLKSLVFPAREFLGCLGEEPEPPLLPELIVIGAKGCDVSALRIHDYVFLKTEPQDPLYAAARERLIVVSCDCTAAREVCFCTAVGEQPYAKDGFDINLSVLDNCVVIESGSEKGLELLSSLENMLIPADTETIDARSRSREAMSERVRVQSAENGLKEGCDFRTAIESSEESGMWDEFAADCVECGACNFICCTCHCFLLADGVSSSEGPARIKQWDSCLYRNFASVAGGANPRGHRSERLYNRFDKKFSFFPQVLGGYACDGCGRCVEACTGNIDIREVLKRAVDEL